MQRAMPDALPMDDRHLGDIARRQAGVVTTRQLVACGLSRAGIAGRSDRGRLFPVMRSVYSLGPCVDDWGLRWAAILATDPERAVLSHWSAGEVHNMVDPRPGPVHVTVPGSGRGGVAGLVVHRSRNLRLGDVVTVRGLRVTSPERTVLDVSGRSTDEAVRRIIREGEFQGVLGTGAVRDAVAGRTGHRGLARVRRVDPATAEAGLRQTPLEDALEPLLVEIAVPGLACQHPVRGGSGAQFRADFAYPAVRLAIEADGRSAHERASAFETDRAREADLGAAGWQTLRFTRLQIHNAPSAVQRAVADTVRARWVLADTARLSARPA